MNRTFRALPALLLVLALLLSSCSFTPTQPREPLPEDTIRENMAASVPGAATVGDYLSAWGLPEYYEQNLAAYEEALGGRFYTAEDTTLSIARDIGEGYLTTYYHTVSYTDKTSVTAAIQKLYLAALAVREKVKTPAADIAAAAENGTEDADVLYSAFYLARFGVPVFNLDKFMAIESIFRQTYYKPLPSALALAQSAATTFTDKLYDTTDLSDTEAVTDALIRAYVLAIGDKYAAYRTALQYEIYDTDMSGSYVGIGVTIQYLYEDGSMEVTAVTEGSPAAEAGIRTGDYLFAIDGAPVSELGYEGTIARVRGEVGTEVAVTVSRGADTITFTMERRAMTEETVTVTIDDNIAYVRITQFKANTGAQFRAVIDRLETAGVRGVIYDLRGNPGGYVSSVLNALSYLVPENTPVISFGSGGGYNAFDNHTFSVPSIVLCNEYTASAGELFTAAMRDYTAMGLQDAVIVGTVTYKKGIMQSTYTLPDKSTLTLTVDTYNPPSGVNYDGVGITPDEIVPMTGTGDAQRDRAYEILRKKLEKNSGGSGIDLPRVPFR